MSRLSDSSEPEEAGGDTFDGTQECRTPQTLKRLINLAPLNVSQGRSFLSQGPNLLQVPERGSKYQHTRRRHSWIPGAIR